MSGNWERRWQPLLKQWVLISAKSALRPWSGQTFSASNDATPEHDPACYLCTGVTRAGGEVNPDYIGVWAFDNDFPSLALQAPAPSAKEQDELQLAAAATGCCRVLVWSEKHNATLAELPPAEMLAVAQLWQAEYRQLSQVPEISQVLIFENKGVEVGVSNLHPHGQIYASGFITDTSERMRDAQHQYVKDHAGSNLLSSMLARPEYQDALLVEDAEYFKTIVPFAARFAFETWIVPKRHVPSIDHLDAHELEELAAVYQRQAQRYDRLFQRKSPNITLLQNAPCDDNPANADWCFHIIQQPPLRDAQTLKYLAGFEMGSNTIVNPVQPEAAAQRLRECSTTSNA